MVSASWIAAIAFGCAFGGALAGMLLRIKLPDDHLDTDSRDVVKLVMGLIATMAALVLSLLVASANTAYQAQSSELQSLSANIILLDRMLTYYGPEADAARLQLHEAVVQTHDRIWPPDRMQSADFDPAATRGATTSFVERLQDLTPKSEAQKAMQSQSLQLAASIARTRLLMFEQFGNSISWPFMAVLVFWICVLFTGFGLFAPFHATVTVTLFVGALSVAGAVFLIVELSHPYSGLLRLSDAPLRGVLEQMVR
jgi:hypothetical protein